MLAIFLVLGLVEPHPSYRLYSFGELAVRADLVVAGRISELDETHLVLDVEGVLAGELPEPDTCRVRRFVNWTCASRWTRYEIDQEALYFVEYERSPGGELGLRILGAAGEGEMPLLTGAEGDHDDRVLLRGLVRGMSARRHEAFTGTVAAIEVPRAEVERIVRELRTHVVRRPASIGARTTHALEVQADVSKLEALVESSRLAEHVTRTLFDDLRRDVHYAQNRAALAVAACLFTRPVLRLDGRPWLVEELLGADSIVLGEVIESRDEVRVVRVERSLAGERDPGALLELRRPPAWHCSCSWSEMPAGKRAIWFLNRDRTILGAPFLSGEFAIVESPTITPEGNLLVGDHVVPRFSGLGLGSLAHGPMFSLEEFLSAVRAARSIWKPRWCPDHTNELLGVDVQEDRPELWKSLRSSLGQSIVRIARTLSRRGPDGHCRREKHASPK